MSAAFTPGPYEYRADRIIAAAGLPLALCYADDRNAEANGPLLAAAPDLYAALDNCPLPSTMGNAADHYRRFYDWLNGPVKAALAKARGEAK
jgi:hypothetical protein